MAVVRITSSYYLLLYFSQTLRLLPPSFWDTTARLVNTINAPVYDQAYKNWRMSSVSILFLLLNFLCSLELAMAQSLSFTIEMPSGEKKNADISDYELSHVAVRRLCLLHELGLEHVASLTAEITRQRAVIAGDTKTLSNLNPSANIMFSLPITLGGGDFDIPFYKGQTYLEAGSSFCRANWHTIRPKVQVIDTNNMPEYNPTFSSQRTFLKTSALGFWQTRLSPCTPPLKPLLARQMT